MLQELLYFEDQYFEDLEHIFAFAGPWNSISVLVFTGTTDDGFNEEWREHFALIKRKTDFLFCLFFHVLIDQALHFTRQSQRLKTWSQARPYIAQPKLNGILGTHNSNVSPFYLLTAAALWLNGEIDVDGKLIAYSNLFRLESEKQNLPYDFLVTHAIAPETRRFLIHKERFHHPYFDNQKPDVKLLKSWGALLLQHFVMAGAD